LSEYAWAFRYTGEPEVPEIGEAQDALRIANKVYQAILQRVPHEAHPEKL